VAEDGEEKEEVLLSWWRERGEELELELELELGLRGVPSAEP